MEKEILRKEAAELAGKLTLDEKIGMIHGAEFFRTKGVERLGIPPLKMSDGPMGVRHEFPADSWIPVGLSDDYVTYLPCNSALASTWNRRLAFELGSVLGEEARGRGKDIILGPGVNIKRSPLCGRNFEYFSEDPYLTSELAVPYVRGVQLWDVAACVKHFAANNQETQRLQVDVKIDEETLRTIYLPAFYEALTAGGAYSVMGAYNKIEGEHCCESNHLLKTILRDEWGYDGVVVSDWGGVHDTKLAASSMLDVEMSVTTNFDEYCLAAPLKEMVEKKEVDEADIDEKVIHILMLMMRLHMMDGKRQAGAYNTPEHRQSAYEVAAESVVLLKNEKHRLPLNPKETERVLMIGDNAKSLHAGSGGSAEIKALYEISPLLGVKMLLGGNAEVAYAQGYCRNKGDTEIGTNWQEKSLENGGGSTAANKADEELAGERRRLREEALKMAKEFDTVIYVGGLNHNQDTEGSDRADMKLPYEQDILISSLLEIRPDAVIVLTGGSPVEMGAWIEKADSLVWGWYAGMEGGKALAEVLFGVINPSGKLPETFYKTHTDCSAHCLGEFPGGSSVTYREGQFVGYRYNDTFGVEPQFPFGYGLSYTQFAYADAGLVQEDGEWYAQCDVTNTGECTGAETVQLYLAPKERSENQPVQELKGFTKVKLQPGKTARVQIKIKDYQEGCEVRIGSSSRDIRLKI